MTSLRSLRWAAACVFAIAAGCSKDDDGGKSANLPMITPPVHAATPAGLRAPAGLALSLGAADFSQRFFAASGGPTSMKAS